jgi:hypothetical protein
MLASLAVAIALCARPAMTAEKAPNDRLLTPRTYAFVTVPNVNEFKTRFGQSLTGQMLRDPKLSDFLSDVGKKFGQLGEEFQKRVGLKLDDVLAIPDGELSIAVMQPSESTKLAVAVLLDFGKSGSTVNAILEKASAALEKDRFKKSTKDFEGSQITVFNREKEKKDGDADGDKSESSEPDFGAQLAYVVKENTLLFTTSVTALQDILRRWDGKHSETLAEVPAYKAVINAGKQGNANPVLVWYVNPVTLVQAFLSSSQSADPTIGMAMGLLTPLGVMNLKGIGGSIHLVTDDFDMESRTVIYLDQPASGLLSVLHFPAEDETPPKWVTDDSTAYFAINWSIGQAFTAVEGLVDQFLGPGATAQKLEDWAGEEPKVHLKKDVIDNLDGKVHIVTDMADSGKPDSARLLIAIGVRDSKKMKGVLEKVAKLPNFPGKPREFRGETIYNLDSNPLFGNASRTMGVAIVHDSVMFSNDVARLEQVIVGDKDRKPLADSDRYKTLAKHFPTKTSILGYQHQDTQIKSLYEMFRSGKVSDALANSDFGKVLEGIDFKKLPDFEVIEKYLPSSGTYAVPHGNGALIVGFTLKQPLK